MSSNERPPIELPPGQWPNISTLIAKAGHITVGHIAPIESAAIAADEHSLLATLVRKPGESFDELMNRLDDAVGRALNHGINTNEIDQGHFELATPKSRRGK